MNTPRNKPLASYYNHNNRLVGITPTDITEPPPSSVPESVSEEPPSPELKVPASAPAVRRSSRLAPIIKAREDLKDLPDKDMPPDPLGYETTAFGRQRNFRAHGHTKQARAQAWSSAC